MMNMRPTSLKLPEGSGNQCNTCRLEQMLTCSRCGDRFTEPLMLPCQHLFCREPCLQGILKGLNAGDKVKCPVCQHAASVPEKGIAAYSENSVIDRLLLVPRGEMAVLSQECNTEQKEQVAKGFRTASASKLDDLRRKQQAKQAKRALEKGCTKEECLVGTDFDITTFKNKNKNHIHCDDCNNIIDHTQLSEHIWGGVRSVSGPRLKDSVDHLEDIQRIHNKKVRTVHFDSNGVVEEYDTAPEEVMINQDDGTAEKKKKKKKKKRVAKSKALATSNTNETKKSRNELFHPRGHGPLRLKLEERCTACHKRPISDVCFHCSRKVCNWCFNNHLRPIVANANRIVDEYNANQAAEKLITLGMQQPGLATFLGDKPLGYNHDVVRESYNSIINQFLTPRELRIMIGITNFRDDDLEPYDAHLKAMLWLNDAVAEFEKEVIDKLDAADDVDVLDEIASIEREIVRFKQMHDKLNRLDVIKLSVMDIAMGSSALQDLDATVKDYDKEKHSRNPNAHLVGRLAKMVHHKLDIVYTLAIHLNQKIKCGLLIKEAEVKEETKKTGRNLKTYSGKDSDGIERLYWGDRKESGPQLYIKGLQSNKPDGHGNPVTSVPLPKPDSDDDSQLTEEVSDAVALGALTSGDIQLADEATHRVAIPGDFPFSMEHINNQCKLLYAKYKRNGGRPISKKLTEEISIRAEHGGENGTPNLIIHVKARKPEQFEIPPNSEAAVAFSEAGLEINSDNYSVEYAVGKGKTVRPYLRPKTRKNYTSFDDFEFDKWKVPGVGSGITADGGVIYCVGKDGQVEIKGDEHQDSEFNSMVMEALDDID